MAKYRIVEFADGTFSVQHRTFFTRWKTTRDVADGIYSCYQDAHKALRDYLSPCEGSRIVKVWFAQTYF